MVSLSPASHVSKVRGPQEPCGLGEARSLLVNGQAAFLWFPLLCSVWSEERSWSRE